MHPHVLQLDIQGTPQAWISLEQAVLHYATGSVAWEDGDLPLATLRGGFNVARGVQSRVDVAPIIALRGASKINLFDVVPSVTKGKLLRRDRHTCAYCAQVFLERDLQCEHVMPESRGGPWTWTNLVSACGACNNRKAAHARGSRHAAGVPAVRAEPLRELSARRPQRPRGRARVAGQAPAQGLAASVGA